MLCSVWDGAYKGNVLFNDSLNTFYLWLYGIRHMAKDQLDSLRKPTATTTWASFQLVAWDLLHASSHRQDSAHHDICYTSGGVLAGTQNSSVGPS